ncbi:MAG: rhomboid family intramembrane serine protease [Methylococcaceae bacterium]|nr:rhomboid family intramembrane serine protease [Methylococcaceae bacterium]
MIPIRDTAPCNITPWVTWSIIAVCVGIFIGMKLMPFELQQWIILHYGMVPLRYSNPHLAAQYGLEPDGYLSALTGLFLHDGWLHILINVCFLWIFADNIEARMGHFRFIVFYVLCGLASMAMQWYFVPDFVTPVLGASGAIAGVLAAYFFLYPYARVVIWVPILLLPIFINVPAIVFLGGWVIWQLYQATTIIVFHSTEVTVAWWAHLGGFIAGGVLFRWFLLPLPATLEQENKD